MRLNEHRAIHEHMRALRWRESHLFGNAYTRGAWCVGLWPDGWSLSVATDAVGVYAIKARGVTLRELRVALLNLEQISQEAVKL